MDKDNEDKMQFISNRDGYLWAFYRLKVGLDIIDNLNEQIPRIMDIGETYGLIKNNLEVEGFKKAQERYSANLKEVSEQVKKDGLKDVYVSLNSNDKFEKYFFERIVRNQVVTIISKMSIVYIVALFEDFLQKILGITFKNKPEILKTCQKSVTYEDLIEFGDFEKAKNAIIEKELLVINEDIEEIKSYIVKKFNIDISKFTDWNIFKERFYRRNIIVHNSGIPNSIYREKTGYKGENVALDTTQEYLRESISIFLAIPCQMKQAFETKMVL